MCAVPLLMQLLVRQSAGVLSSCSQQLKYLVHNYTQRISLPSVDALDQLVRGEWPQLAVVVVNKHLGSSFEWPHSGTLDLCATIELSQGSAHSTACIVRSKQHGAQLQPPLQDSHLSTATRFVSNIDQLNVSRLCFTVQKLDIKTVALLIAAAGFKVQQLHVEDDSLDAGPVLSAAKSCSPWLERLHLRLSNIGTDAIKNLLERRWPRLQSLSLTRTSRCHEQPTYFTPTWTSWPHLSCLCLTGIPLDPFVMHLLVCNKCVWLHSLCLSSSSLGGDAILALSGGMWLQLQVLGLGENKLGANHIVVLEKASFARLNRLELHGNPLNAAAMKHLVACKLPCLQALRLDDNLLDNSAMVHLAQGDWPGLTHLYINNTFVDAAGINELTKGDWLHLQHLRLDRTAARVYPVSEVPEWFVGKLGISQSHAISPIYFGRKSCEVRCMVGVTKHEVVWFEAVQSSRESYVMGDFQAACLLFAVLVCFSISVPLTCITLCLWGLKECCVKCLNAVKHVFVAWVGLPFNFRKRWMPF